MMLTSSQPNLLPELMLRCVQYSLSNKRARHFQGQLTVLNVAPF